MTAANSSHDRILIIDDDPSMAVLVRGLLARENLDICSSMSLADGVRMAGRQRFDVILLDHVLPDGKGLDHVEELVLQDRLRPILYITAQTGAHPAIEAIKRGAFDYLAKPIDFGLLKMRLEEALEYRQLTRLPVLVDSQADGGEDQDVLVGRCRSMQNVYKCIGRLSLSPATVLVEGEVGTGKEMVARAIHQYGPGHLSTFLKLSLDEFRAAMWPSPSMPDRSMDVPALRDLFPEGDGGTLYVEEIGGLTNAQQSRLLVCLQNLVKEPSNVRVILSTSIASRSLLEHAELRGDLYYFLSPYLVQMPPLREREGDFEMLVAHFMQRLVRVWATNETQGPPRVSTAAMKLLRGYDWPGNVAQLKSVLQSVLMESQGAVLATSSLYRALGFDGKVESTTINALPEAMNDESTWDLKAFVDERLTNGDENLYEQAISHLDRALLVLVLRHTQGNQAQAAKLLGMTRTSLRKKVMSVHINLATLGDSIPSGEVEKTTTEPR